MGEEWKGKIKIPPERAGSAVDLWFIRAAQNVIDADIIKISKNNQRIRRRNALAGFIFGYECLLDARFHLQGNLSQAAQLAEVVLHDTSPKTFCHIVCLTHMTYCHIMRMIQSKL